MVKFVNCSFCLAFSGAIILGMSANGSYTRGLIKYLREESKLYQVMFITDERIFRNSSPSINFLVTDVSKHFPTLSTSFARMQFDFQKHLSPSLQMPRRTTLFVTILDGNQNDTWVYVYKVLMKLKLLSQGHSYPRCLINFFSQTEPRLIKEFLEYCWFQGFLDISVLEHFQENQTSLKRGTSKLPILHGMNPFAKTYTAREVTAQTKWFPKKLQNLYGYPIKFIYGSFVKNKKILDYQEYQRFVLFFSKAMHCTVASLTVNTVQYDRLLYTLYKERAEMIFNTMITTSSGSPKIRILGFASVKAVIPNTSRFSKVFVISQEFIYMIIATTVAIGAIRITAWIMKFNRSTWQTFNISQLVMGMSTITEPEELAERIVFGVLMLSCIVYSGYFFSVILDISFRAEPQISSLEELADSSLTPIMTFLLNKTLAASSIPYVRKIGKKSITVNQQVIGGCLAYLAENENITCIMANAEEKVNYFMARRQESFVKVLQEPLAFYTESWVARNGSPFLDRFNQVILRASECGLITKLRLNSDRGTTKLAPPEEIGKEKLLLIVCYSLAIGYTLAIIAFVAEMISVIGWRKPKQICRQFFHCRRE